MLRVILFIIVMFSCQVHGAEKTINVAVNIGAPWAYYDEEKGVTGIDVEIIRYIFNQMGYETKFHLLAYNRLIKEFNEGKHDVASPAAFPAVNGSLTSRYLPFKDVAVSLKKDQISINTIDDLREKSIIAYQYATSVLGEEFSAAISDANYLEIVERELQLKLLVNKRTDIVIGEKRLLTYIMRNLYPDNELSIHPIFETKSYGAILKNPDLLARFNQELINIRMSGVYQKILNQWP